MTTPECAFLLAIQPHGDSAAILTVFTEDSGLKRGLIRGIKKKMNFLQPGNKLSLTHSRRLENQLGTFNAEAHTDYTTPALHSAACLNSINYLTELLARTLPEEQPMPSLFNLTDVFLQDLISMGNNGLWQRLAFYELTLLTTMGYGLSLTPESGAIACPSKTPLTYVSPKTGCAVSQVMGHPYADKLFILPHLFGGPEPTMRSSEDQETTDQRNTFTLTGYFLEKLLHHKHLDSRTYALQALTK